MAVISWARVARALDFYQARGYVYVVTPWVVSPAAHLSTWPGGDVWARPEGWLVGSAEQGFIELAMTGRLPRGRLVSAGPCFRPGDGHSPEKGVHPFFFKVELWGDPGTETQMLEDARVFFREERVEAHIVQTTSGRDLYSETLELGSYGKRSTQGLSWSYGTGLAEPRFSLAPARTN